MIKTLGVLARSLKGFFSDGGVMLSASMAYFIMMTILPFSILIVYLTGYMLGQYEVFYRFFTARLGYFFPQATEHMVAQLKRLIYFKKTGEAGMVLYGLLSYGLFFNVEGALNTVFKVKKRRHFLFSAAMGLVMATAIVSFILLSFTLEAAGLFPGLAVTVKTPGFFHGAVLFFYKFILPFSVLFVVTGALYFFLPAARIKPADAMRGGLFTSLMIELAKHGFTLYVKRVIPGVGTIYGPLTAFVLFLLWVFYSSCIFLLGAEIVHYMGEANRR
jgi:membrane protein